MSDKLSNNLKLLMSEARLNAEELSRRIGMPACTIKKIRNDSGANPTLSTLAPLAKYFSLTISQLVGDEPFPENRLKGSYALNQETLNYIPLISWKEAITWPETQTKKHTLISTEHTYSKNTYALLVEEDDWDNFSKNTALLIDPALKLDHRDFVIVHKIGQKLPTLRQALLDEGQIYLKPLTQGYQIVPLTAEHQILGIVVEYKKQLRSNS